MNQALRNAIYVTGKTVSGLSATNFRFERVPEGTAFPYCFFTEIATPIENDSASQFEMCTVQFVFSGKILTGIDTLVSATKAVFDYGKANLTVSGYTVIQSIRTLDLGPHQIDNIWNHFLQYDIEISGSR